MWSRAVETFKVDESEDDPQEEIRNAQFQGRENSTAANKTEEKQRVTLIQTRQGKSLHH